MIYKFASTYLVVTSMDYYGIFPLLIVMFQKHLRPAMAVSMVSYHNFMVFLTTTLNQKFRVKKHQRDGKTNGH